MGWKFKVFFTVLLLLIPFLVPAPDPAKLFELQAGDVLVSHLESLVPKISPEEMPAHPVPFGVSISSLVVHGPEGSEVRDALARRVREWSRTVAYPGIQLRLTDQNPDLVVQAEFLRLKDGFQWKISHEEDPFLSPSKQGKVSFFSWISLLPPFAAILAAILIGRTILGLFIGAFLGAWILALPSPHLLSGLNLREGPGPFLSQAWSLLLQALENLPKAVEVLFVEILYRRCLMDQFNLAILGFVVFLSATVGVTTRMGGIQGFVEILRKRASTLRTTQLVTFLMGVAIFFDDYANTIVVGNTMRPLTDRLRLAREKLAYIVDSTSAPVAGLSVISTWIAYEVTTFSAQLPEVGIPKSQGYAIFISTLPFRFYCIFALFLVLLTILLKREFGPMRAACERALRTGELVRKGGKPLVSADLTNVAPKEGAPARAANALLPLLLLIGFTVVGIYVLGMESVYAIFWASFLAFLLAAILALVQGILRPVEILVSAYKSSRALTFAIAILLLAWAIGHVCRDLGTAPYLVASFTHALKPEILPTVLFAAGCLISFSTGSSWSTMALLLPNVVVLSWSLGAHSHLGNQGLLILSIGAVLEGSIFGDHCSPISDTTILSSVASASDHMDHTRTQMPYAMLAMATALAAGYIPVAYLGHVWVYLSLPMGALLMTLFLFFLGRDPEKSVLFLPAPGPVRAGPSASGLPPQAGED